MEKSITKYVFKSENTKLSKNRDVDATYANIDATCSDDCFFKNTSCYAKQGNVGIHSSRLIKTSAITAARDEAQKIISAAKEGRISKFLRLHVSGDCKTIQSAKEINKAIKVWKLHGGLKAWTYTHSWKKVKRKYFKDISVLASVEKIEDIEAARAAGYAPAIVVQEHKTDKAFKLSGCETKFIPCPNQTRDVTCVDCKLCLNADKLHKMNTGIAFAIHGVMKNRAKKYLPVLKLKISLYNS